ncbi:amino acid permease/ SLC12A domain-containing protein [Aspergillus varians]
MSSIDEPKQTPKDVSEEHQQEIFDHGEGEDETAKIHDMKVHRRLSNRQIQLSAIAGSIGAALFVAIGGGLRDAGPLALFLGFSWWSTVVFAVSQCQLETVSYFPLDGSFIRIAGRCVDPAFGAAIGFNFFFLQVTNAILELTVFDTLVGFWDDSLSPAITISAMLVFYFALNIWRVDWYGEVEFWISIGKVLLAVGLIFYTFITMVGANPLHWVYGFHYWKDPGFWVGGTVTERFEAFLAGVISACLIICGPDFLSIISGEAKAPRKTMPRALRTVGIRLLVIYVIGSLCVGIVVSHKDPLIGNGGYAASSPYVISMIRLKIPVLPSVVNAALMTSILSAGNNYVFGSSRSLMAMGEDGFAPRFVTRVNRNGVPWISVLIVLLIGCFSYMALGSGASTVLTWIINFATAANMIDWIAMSLSWIRFNAGLKAQGLDRKELLPALSKWQPFAAWYALCCSFVMLFVQGYAVFKPGNWDTATFFFNYGLIFVGILIYGVVKIWQKTKIISAKDIDFFSEVDIIDKYEALLEAEEDGEKVSRARKIINAIF